MTKILCPHCHRVLGDTRKSLDCNINCRWCKKPMAIKIVMAKSTDYFGKEEEND